MSKEAKGLTFDYQKHEWLFSNNVGRILSFPKNLALLTPESSFKSLPESSPAEFKTIYRDVFNNQWNSEYEVYLNHSPFFRQLVRLFKGNKRTNLFSRLVLGTPTTIITSLAGKLARADSFNPYTQTVQIYHPNKYIGMHEIAHADIFDKSKHPNWQALAYNVIPPYTVAVERQASINATNQLLAEHQKDAAKILEPAWGSYFGGLTSFMSASFPGMLPLTPLMPLVGMAAGHIHSRLGKFKLF